MQRNIKQGVKVKSVEIQELHLQNGLQQDTVLFVVSIHFQGATTDLAERFAQRLEESWKSRKL